MRCLINKTKGKLYLFLLPVPFNIFKSDILIFDNKKVSLVFNNRVKAIHVKIKHSFLAK